MKLGAYLQANSLSQAAFGERIDRTQGRVSQLVRGSWPSREEVEKIITETAGAVTANDWLDATAEAVAQ